MGKRAPSVVQPFSKIMGIGPESNFRHAPAESRLPPGHRWKETRLGDPYYLRAAQEGDRDERLTVAEANLRRQRHMGDNDPLQGFKYFSNVEYQAVPINQDSSAPRPATAPASASAPSASPPSPMGTPAPSVSPLSGGPQPSQPAQPSTPARPAVQAASPRPAVSGADPGTATTPGVSRRRGRRPFVKTAAVGLTTPAQTQKKTLLGG